MKSNLIIKMIIKMIIIIIIIMIIIIMIPTFPPSPTNDLAQVFSLSVHQEMRKLKQLKTLAIDGSANSVNILFPYI